MMLKISKQYKYRR